MFAMYSIHSSDLSSVVSVIGFAILPDSVLLPDKQGKETFLTDMEKHILELDVLISSPSDQLGQGL